VAARGRHYHWRIGRGAAVHRAGRKQRDLRARSDRQRVGAVRAVSESPPRQRNEFGIRKQKTPERLSGVFLTVRYRERSVFRGDGSSPVESIVHAEFDRVDML
jgi:hypothetical protein